MALNAEHRKALVAVFKEPVVAGLTWPEVESRLEEAGAELTRGRGSRVRVHLNGVRAVFHSAGPDGEAGRQAVVSLGRFLLEAGVQAEE